MKISAIVAMDSQNGIGVNNQLPWHLPNDLKFFKSVTMGKPIIMGRKTYESLGRPLPGRLNVVISSQQVAAPESVVVLNSIEAALAYVAQQGTEEVFIIGGGQIFAASLPILNTLYITEVHTTVAADIFFPKISVEDWSLDWQEEHPADEQHQFAYTFKKYLRK
jgi:dihydrofolate reductase